MRGYDDWKLETPEDDAHRRDRFMRKLNDWRRWTQPEREYEYEERLADIREKCKADYQRTGGEDE